MPQVLLILGNGLSAAFEIFIQLITEMQLGSWFITCFSIYMIYRFLLRPFLGAGLSVGSSDKVKKTDSEEK